MLENARHEAFAQGVAQGQRGRTAYMAAYPTCTKAEAADAGASKLLRRPDVKARVEEMIAAGAEKAGVTVERIVSELAVAAFAEPRAKASWHDKVAALEKLGKHLGMFREKVEVTGQGGGPVAIDLPPSELMRRLAYLLTKPKEA